MIWRDLRRGASGSGRPLGHAKVISVMTLAFASLEECEPG